MQTHQTSVPLAQPAAMAAITRQADSQKWHAFMNKNKDVQAKYEELRMKVHKHEASRQALQDFRATFSSPEGYQMSETARSHLRAHEKLQSWQFRPKTFEQLLALYHCPVVVGNVCSYLEEQGLCRFSAMTRTKVWDHPDYMLELSDRVSKQKEHRESTGMLPSGMSAAAAAPSSKPKPMLALCSGLDDDEQPEATPEQMKGENGAGKKQCREKKNNSEDQAKPEKASSAKENPEDTNQEEAKTNKAEQVQPEEVDGAEASKQEEQAKPEEADADKANPDDGKDSKQRKTTKAKPQKRRGQQKLAAPGSPARSPEPWIPAEATPTQVWGSPALSPTQAVCYQAPCRETQLLPPPAAPGPIARRLLTDGEEASKKEEQAKPEDDKDSKQRKTTRPPHGKRKAVCESHDQEDAAESNAGMTLTRHAAEVAKDINPEVVHAIVRMPEDELDKVLLLVSSLKRAKHGM